MIFIVLVVVPSLASAEVVVFDKYETTMEYEDGILHVTKELRLKNVGTSPIIPGEIHFKLSEDSKNGPIPPDISSFNVINKFDTPLETRKIVSEHEVDLVFTVWDPLLPDFFYDMTMTYDVVFNPSGILFYQIALPDEKTTIPVKNSKTSFLLPKQFHVTYAPDAEIESLDEHTSVSWDSVSSYNLEYSLVPFPRTGIPAVNIFWVIIISLFLIHLFIRMRKKARLVATQL